MYADALIVVAYTFAYLYEVLPILNTLSFDGTNDELKLATTLTVSAVASPIVIAPPNVKLPSIAALPVIFNDEPLMNVDADTDAPTNVDDVPAVANCISPLAPPTNNVPNVVFTYGSPNANEPDCCAVVPRLNLSAI